MTIPSLDLIISWQHYLRLAGASGYTIESWGHALQRCHDQLPHGLDAASTAELAEWLANPAWSSSTRASYRSALRAFYTWACDPDDPWLEYNPAARLLRIRRQRRPPKPCADDELTRILATAADPNGRHDYRLWILIAAYTGARCIELARLRREDVTGRVVYLHGKRGRYRAVPTIADVWQAVEDRPAGHLVDRRWWHLDGLSAVDADRQAARYISRDGCRVLHHVCGLPGMSMHRLRHWYLTNVLRTSGNLRVAQDLAGHASPDTTSIYTEVSDQDRWEAVSALPRLAGYAGSADVARR